MYQHGSEIGERREKRGERIERANAHTGGEEEKEEDRLTKMGDMSELKELQNCRRRAQDAVQKGLWRRVVDVWDPLDWMIARRGRLCEKKVRCSCFVKGLVDGGMSTGVTGSPDDVRRDWVGLGGSGWG